MSKQAFPGMERQFASNGTEIKGATIKSQIDAFTMAAKAVARGSYVTFLTPHCKLAHKCESYRRLELLGPFAVQRRGGVAVGMLFFVVGLVTGLVIAAVMHGRLP